MRILPPSVFRPARRFAASVLLAAAAAAACGKKGPPLAPLNIAPDAATAVAARRLGDTVYLQFAVPAKGVAGAAFSIDHLRVYAVTAAPGGIVPPNRDLLRPAFLIAKIPVRPPADPDAPDDPGEKRPRPGDVVTFVETLTPAAFTPYEPPKPPVEKSKPKPPAAAASGAAPAAAAAAVPAGPPVLTRIYVLEGVTSNGHAGAPSARVSVPLLSAPGAPRPGTAAFDESSVTVTWQPPASTSDEAAGVSYNIYAVPAAGTGNAGVPVTAPLPLNTQPLDVTSFTRPGAVPGQPQCFVVRSVAAVGTALIEGDPSDPMCVTPTDTFPPAAPKGLAAVSGSGAINLIWDANTEADLGGYVILRGEAPGDTLQPLTPEPIRETRYVDRTVTPGATYVYAIVAVDTAKPPNRSTPSNKVQETAR